MAARLTKREIRAICESLNNSLAGILDGYDEGSAEYDDMRDAMDSALAKMQDRL